MSTSPHEGLCTFIREYIAKEKVIGWTIRDKWTMYTTSHETCAEWHKLGLDVIPVYIKQEQPPTDTPH